ncbi:MAG: hypothetical protein JWO38_5323 [Gemmataceae bacterium]|nr:hypothetical protein [Gemmataceae bacterium]
MFRSLSASPTLLAVIVTLANAVKPVLVDDTAYLTYAHHIAHHPLDPYGFDIFWYTVPGPAMEVLCPPVVPYWLALGVRLFGGHPVGLKLWLFPFVWLLAWSLRELLRRFARGVEQTALPLIVLSPAVLPMVNLMLDIPALALGLFSLVAFIRAARRDSWWLAVASGLVAAVAMQTKYTALLVPPLIGWYGLTHRRRGPAAAAVIVAGAAFAGWELFLVAEYGRSHFLVQLSDQQPSAGAAAGRLAALIREKYALVPPLAGHLGCLAVGVGLYAGRAIGFPRRLLLVSTVLWVVGAGLVAVLPHRASILIPGNVPGHAKLTLAITVWRTAGAAVLLTAAGCAGVLLVRSRWGRGVRWSADSAFVVGWVVLELAGYFVLTPFPAARRVVGLTVAITVLAARTVSRVNRANPGRRPPGWVLPFGVTVGVLVAALDAYDALPEKVVAEEATVFVQARPPTARAWYVGHWGFQYYCERAGMRPVIPGGSILAAGDYLVLPLFPDEQGFYRPYPGSIVIRPPVGAVEKVADLVWDDCLSAQTIPNFYGGTEPVIGRDHPRLRVAVYRIINRWAVPGR